MGWDRLTLPQGAVDGSISWIRAWEKLLVHPPSASMELVFGAARGVPMSHGLHRGAVRSPSRPGQANDDHWWGGMQSTLLKLTGRVVNDRVSLSITRRRRPHIALGGCRREYKTLFVVFDGFLPRLNSVKTSILRPLREDGGGPQELDVRSKSGIAPSSTGVVRIDRGFKTTGVEPWTYLPSSRQGLDSILAFWHFLA